MAWPHRISAFIKRWRASGRAEHQLDALLAHADPAASSVSRNAWLIELAYWVRHSPSSSLRNVDQTDLTSKRAFSPVIRLRYLLDVLERNPVWKASVVSCLHAIFAELDAVALLSDTGLPQSPSIWSELRERLALRLIPATPNTRDWEQMLTLIFPKGHGAQWIAAIDSVTWKRLHDLFADDAASDLTGHFRRDIGNALRMLIAQVRAAAFSTALRSRMQYVRLEDSPFMPLERVVEALLEMHAQGRLRTVESSQQLNVLRGLLDQSRAAIAGVFSHLDENGVNVDIEFQVERILARLNRIDMLLELLVEDESSPVGQKLLGALVQSNQDRLSVSGLVRKTFARLARKVVDRSAETGDHYITRTHTEYWSMLKAAAGGGLVTVMTVYLKFAITSMHVHRLFEFLLSSLNYAGSFVFLQFAGLTLATKQPAMTAPALARRLDDVGKQEGMELFVDETLSLIRSQAAAVFGNVALVIPGAFVVQWVAFSLWGAHLITPEKAHATVASFSIFGLTPLYAVFTGVLLWLSSLIAGWADNWFVYRRIEDVIGYNRRLRFLVGTARAHRIGRFWREHVSGLAGNISLGILLSLTPYLADIFALHIEVRHVTLSSGSLAAAVGVLGFSLMTTAAFWYAVAGIAAMAVLNVGVSFTLAFQLALRSRELPGTQRSSIYRALARAVWRSPQRLFVVGSAGQTVGQTE